MKRIAQRCREEETSRSVVPVVVVQASPEDIGASARLDYYCPVLMQLRGHVAVKDRLMNLALATKSGKKSNDPAEWLDMHEAVEYALELLGVKTVFVNEAQHIWMVETVVSLCKEGETALTIQELKRHAIQADQRLCMEMEARTGEYKVERAKAQSEQELQQLLGKPAAIPGIVTSALHRANDVTTSSTAPFDTRMTNQRKRIERAPSRDFVGGQIRAGNAMKCSFSGVLGIKPLLFLESGVSRVECPECAAMRSLELRGEVLRFPSHDKRKTRTLQTGRRWTKHETAWEVVGG
jgi:hypothetical protein